jgi:hypothetical protein
MGDLAALDEYSMLYGPQPEPQQPEAPPPELPAWTRHSGTFEPQVGSFPSARIAPPLPDVGPPAIGNGGQFSPGTRVGNAAAEVGSDLASALIPQDALDVGLTVATGGGSKLARAGLGGLISSAGVDEAQAAKAPKASASVIDKITETLMNPSLRKKAEALRGKYAHYGEAYPDTGPPELMWKLPDPNDPTKFQKKAGGSVPYATLEEALAKDKEPGFFLEKKHTPEVEQFQKDRNIIQKDMDAHGYERYFDPAKRYDVDPANHGPFADTGVEAQPKSQKTRDEWAGKYGSEEIRARLRAGYEKGKTLSDTDRWYHMGQLEDAYVRELGPEKGRAAFGREFADMMAATTGGANPYDNYLMSHYAGYIDKQGGRLPDRGYKLPFPIGGRFASGNLAQAQKYLDEGNAHWPVDNSKRYDFSSAFKGNPNASTIDEQMMGAFDPTLKDKQPKWYGPATVTARQEALKYGEDPRGFQDITWAGLKALKQKPGTPFEYEGPMINHINRSIETTHRLTGMPRDEIVRRGVVRKEIPMYGIGGAAVMGGVAAQDGYQQDERM